MVPSFALSERKFAKGLNIYSGDAINGLLMTRWTWIKLNILSDGHRNSILANVCKTISSYSILKPQQYPFDSVVWSLNCYRLFANTVKRKLFYDVMWIKENSNSYLLISSVLFKVVIKVGLSPMENGLKDKSSRIGWIIHKVLLLVCELCNGNGWINVSRQNPRISHLSSPKYIFQLENSNYLDLQDFTKLTVKYEFLEFIFIIKCKNRVAIKLVFQIKLSRTSSLFVIFAHGLC